MKMIIFNCPAYKGLTRDIPDWLDNTNCGHYAGQVPCQDCTDCLLKQVVKECVNSLRFSCERILAEKLLGLLDIQKVET